MIVWFGLPDEVLVVEGVWVRRQPWRMPTSRFARVRGDLAVAGGPAVIRPIQPDDLGQQMRIRRIRLRPDGEWRSRYRATCNG